MANILSAGPPPWPALIRDDLAHRFDHRFHWRDFDPDDPPQGLTFVHSDRMCSMDPVSRIFGVERFSREHARRIVDLCSAGKLECVGFAVSCDRWKGHETGLFYVIARPGER